VQWVRTHRYLLLRRLVQTSLLLLFLGNNLYGWTVLQGNLSSSRLFGRIPLVDPFAVLQIMATRTLVSATALLGAGIVLAFFGLLAGRAFCSWVCPVNMVTDLADSVGRWTNSRMLIGRMNRTTRYWTFGLSLVLSSILGLAAFEWISPVSTLHRGIIYGMGTGWTVVLAVFLFDALAIRNGFCGHLCPLGAFYSLAGRFGALRVMHARGRCTGCMRCVESCPEPQVLPFVGLASGPVTSGECTNCGKCIDVCPEQAMQYGIRYFTTAASSRKEGMS
jgi:ferredoxin-type protein NapH